MSWNNVRLILMRELRDQLRDKRTLFTVAILPVLLYPLMGMVVLQVSQFTHDEPARVWVIGDEQLDKKPPILADEDGEVSNLIVTRQSKPPLSAEDLDTIEEQATDALDAGTYDAVVYFPPGFNEELAEFRRRFSAREVIGATDDDELPKLHIFYDGARDRSRIAHARLDGDLHAWRYQVVTEPLKRASDDDKPAQPFEVAGADISQPEARKAVVWAKILPFVLMVWALTGAFYPAVDLCAGEKERGTLETLLTSPARRREIVWGKLLAISTFSGATALLNLISMGATGTFVMSRLASIGGGGSLAIGPPPLASIGWLLLALVPASVMFSALALSIATMARSTKEGQYYLVPLLLISMPLMVLAMLPATTLTLGTSLVPVTGLMLWLRKLVEGQYADAWRYAMPVASVTAVCVLVSIRWATGQFNREEVLFRESERFSLGLWLHSLIRDRRATPTVAAALFGAAFLLVLRFFASFVFPPPQDWNSVVLVVAGNLVLFIAIPAIAMTLLFARSMRQTLLLHSPPKFAILAAAGLAVFMHPLVHVLAGVVQQVFPVTEETLAKLDSFQTMLDLAPGLWAIVLLVALTPAVCEELAFRGFILSGLRRLGSKWEAILISSIFFGVAHGMIHQSVVATFTGLVLGYIAVQTRSLLPCIVYHFVNNAMALMIVSLDVDFIKETALRYVIDVSGKEIALHWWTAVFGLAGVAAILVWFARLPHVPTREERLAHRLDAKSAPAGPS